MFKNDGLFHFYGFLTEKSGFQYFSKNYHPEPYLFNNNNYQILILGNPIYSDRISKKKVVSFLIKNLKTEKLKNIDIINGEFLILIYNKIDKSFYIINDRFSSIPIYYMYEKNKFTFSVSYYDLYSLNNLSNFIDSKHIFEFFWFSRMIGEKNLDSKSKFLSSASILYLNKSGLYIKKYWHPDFRKSDNSLDDLSIELSTAFKNSVNLKNSDNPKPGLFLSGGVDSRIILSAFENPPVCYTMAVSRNVEFQVAKKVASIKKAKHRFLHLPDDIYSQILDKSSILSGSLYNYDHAIFLNYGEKILRDSNVAFHGHGIDYMFQGMYIPYNSYKIFGKDSFIKIFKNIKNPSKYFVNNIPYRTKYVDLFSYLKNKNKSNFYEYLISECDNVINKSNAKFSCDYDKYEYLITSDLSRHYSNTNISSIMTYMEQRTISFENQIFDLYHKIPPQMKLNGKLTSKVLKNLNNDMANIITANTKVRAISSGYEKTFIKGLDKIYSKLRKILGNELIFPENERTWSLRDDAFQNEKYLQKSAYKASLSEKIDSLQIFNMDKVQKDIKYWLSDKSKNEKQNYRGGAFMSSLITLDKIL